MKVILTDEAQQDLEDIFEYIDKKSHKASNYIINNIYLIIENLSYFPYTGRYVPEFNLKQFREKIYKNFRIVYSISEKEQIIYIHFIIHRLRKFNTYKSRKF